jgi:hypothetical protein
MEGVTLKEARYGSRKTMVLYMSEKAFSDISPLFNQKINSLPVSGTHPCTRMGIKGYAWTLFAYTQRVYESDGKLSTRYAIYGTCGDSTFGPAPYYYNKRYGGNIRAARIFYRSFLKYVEENRFSLIGKKFGL